MREAGSWFPGAPAEKGGVFNPQGAGLEGRVKPEVLCTREHLFRPGKHMETRAPGRLVQTWVAGSQAEMRRGDTGEGPVNDGHPGTLLKVRPPACPSHRNPVRASVHLGPEDPGARAPRIWAPSLSLQWAETPFLNWGSKGRGHWLPTGKDTGLSCNRALLCPQPRHAIIPMEKNVPATGAQKREGDGLAHL